MSKLFAFMMLLLLAACGATGSGEKPTEADITAAMKKTWEHGETSTRGATDITINSIQIGTTDVSNRQQQFDGVPKDAAVTNAKIDFTQHEHLTTGTTDTRRVMTALVYKDQLNEWTVYNTGVQYIK